MYVKKTSVYQSLGPGLGNLNIRLGLGSYLYKIYGLEAPNSLILELPPIASYPSQGCTYIYKFVDFLRKYYSTPHTC